ncbi:hypothetical protein Aperf_G00000101149 [Anoplocephala perfoliata]
MTSLSVALRILPHFQEEEKDKGFNADVLQVYSNAVFVLSPRSQPSFLFEHPPRHYTFDFIFSPKEISVESQNEVFSSIGLKAVRECLDGFNCSIFAYGMTGTGKSFTIFGTKNSPGLVPHCCKALFDYCVREVLNKPFLEVRSRKVAHLVTILQHSPKLYNCHLTSENFTF